MNLHYFPYSFCQHFLRVKTSGVLTAAEHKAGVFTEMLLYPRTLDSQHLMVFMNVRRKKKEVQVSWCFYSGRRGTQRRSSFAMGGK